MTSRSEMMPVIRPSSTTGKAPIRFSPSRCTASTSRASAVIVSTLLPLSRSTAAMLMVILPDSARCRLDSPTSHGQREDVPHSDPLPSPRHSLMRRFWRIFRLLALLSIVIAVIGVVLVTRGEGEVHASLIIATALGIGLTVLLGTALMTLVFLSAESGHDEQATTRTKKKEEE